MIIPGQILMQQFFLLLSRLACMSDTPNVGLRNERLAVEQRQLDLSFANIASDRGLGYFQFRHLRSDAAPNPMGGVPLRPDLSLPSTYFKAIHRLRIAQLKNLTSFHRAPFT